MGHVDFHPHIYGIIIVTSVLINYISIIINLAKAKVRIESIFFCTSLSFIALFIGAKLFEIVVSFGKYNFLNSPLSSYGAAIGLLLTIILYVIIDKKNRYIILNTFIIHIPLFYSLSKIACLVAGCCYGIEYDGILAIKYSHLDHLVFPVQGAETLCFLLIFIYSFINYKRHYRYNLEMTIMFSAIAKFLLDYLRDSHVGIILSPNQIVSLLFVGIAIILYIRKRIKKTYL